MKLRRVRIENFHRVRGLTIDFDTDGATLIVGKNGVGKSTIFAAILWCLFDRSDRGGKVVGDSVVNPDVGKDCRVAVFLQVNNESLVIERGIKYGPQKENYVSILYSNGHEERHNIGKKTKEDVAESIISILGCDYETFVRSYIIPQQGVVPFGFMTDATMKDFFIEKFLNIKWLADCHEVAKSKKNDCDRGLGDIGNSINFLDRAISNDRSDFERFKEEFKNMEQERALNLKELKKKKREVEKKINETAKDVAKEEKKTKSKSGELKKVHKEIEEASQELQRERDRYYQTKGALEANDNEEKRYRMEMGSLQVALEKADSLINTDCPTCGTRITKKHLPFMIGETKELIKEKEKQIKKLIGRSKELRDAVDRINKDYSLILEKNRQLSQKKERLLEERGDAKLSSLMTALAHLQDSMDVVKSNIQMEENRKNPFEASIERTEARIVENQEQVKVYTDERAYLEEKRNVYLFWMNAFSPQGIQTNILMNITPVLNDIANFYLSSLSDGDLECEFSTVKPLKNGNVVEKFSLTAWSKTGSVNYAGLSGGERKKVDISTALALADVKRSLSPKVLDILVLDEIFTGLDVGGISLTIDLLKEEFNNLPVYVITHQDVDRAQFDKVWEVYKEDGVTKLGYTGTSAGSL